MSGIIGDDFGDAGIWSEDMGDVADRGVESFMDAQHRFASGGTIGVDRSSDHDPTAAVPGAAARAPAAAGIATYRAAVEIVSKAGYFDAGLVIANLDGAASPETALSVATSAANAGKLFKGKDGIAVATSVSQAGLNAAVRGAANGTADDDAMAAAMTAAGVADAAGAHAVMAVADAAEIGGRAAAESAANLTRYIIQLGGSDHQAPDAAWHAVDAAAAVAAARGSPEEAASAAAQVLRAAKTETGSSAIALSNAGSVAERTRAAANARPIRHAILGGTAVAAVAKAVADVYGAIARASEAGGTNAGDAVKAAVAQVARVDDESGSLPDRAAYHEAATAHAIAYIAKASRRGGRAAAAADNAAGVADLIARAGGDSTAIVSFVQLLAKVAQGGGADAVASFYKIVQHLTRLQGAGPQISETGDEVLRAYQAGGMPALEAIETAESVLTKAAGVTRAHGVLLANTVATAAAAARSDGGTEAEAGTFALLVAHAVQSAAPGVNADRIIQAARVRARGEYPFPPPPYTPHDPARHTGDDQN
jgi:trimeric autotransporter adhesin